MVNCAVIMGRLVADPELRTTPNGISVTSFTVAVDRRFTRYFRKGSMIAVQGSIQTRMYEDKNGNKRKAVDLVADNVSFCGSKNESGTGSSFSRDDSFMSAQPAPSYSTADEGDFKEIPEDDLPF